MVWGPVIAGIGGLLGGLLGGDESPPQTSTTQTSSTRPSYTTEELALLNSMYNQFYGNIGAQSPLYSQLMSGYGVPGYTGAPQIGIPEPYREQQELDTATKKAQGVMDLFQQWDEIQKIPNPFVRAAQIKMEAPAIASKYTELVGGDMDINTVKGGFQTNYARWKANPEQWQTSYLQPYEEKLQYAQEAINKQYAPLIEAQQAAAPPEEEFIGPFGAVSTSHLEPQPTEQPTELLDTSVQPVTQPTELTQAEQIAQTQPSTGSPLQDVQAQSPEQLAQMYNLMQQQGQRGIEDWWNQAQRELEQRGISQRGGYEGSGTIQDLGSLLAQKGRMQQDLGTQLGLSQMQAGLQLPYQQLSALEPVRQFEANYQLQQQAPWISFGSQQLALPWGQAQSTTTPGSSVGVIPGAISGLYSGMGLYGMGQNLGWWGIQNQPATAYGAGGTGPMSWNPNAYDMY